ncbi:MAG: hypothetical protein HFJ11_03265 [Bacilli bacterium]|nr:hypothetical protein [Bacilli bacterium]
MNFLLSDEKEISFKDYEIRKKLYQEFMNLPESFVSKMRHFQPQIGCFNNCSFCSKFSVCKSEYWKRNTLRNIVSALKYTAINYTKDDLLLAWDRKEHRVGVVFPYLNNDIAAYPYLEDFIDLCYKELGVRTRISTVGFSRFNKVLNKVHQNICTKEIYALAGVRLSISQYGRVWEDKNNKVSLSDYAKDLGNFLNIYKPYYFKFGAGSRKMCVELRYNPLVVNADVFDFEYKNHHIIAVSNYLYISKKENEKLPESFIINPYNHSLEFNNNGIKYLEYNLNFKVHSEEEIKTFINSNKIKKEKEVELYLFKNKDGIYYSINPKLTEKGNYGINIYPKTNFRKAGYIITERFFLNALYKFKEKRNLTLKDNLQNLDYSDIEEVMSLLKENILYYEKIGKLEKSTYIKEHIVPILEVYINAIKIAKYPAEVFFDKNFTIDTGMICNLGRAINLFKGLTSFINEPLTPIHERNYGRHCSTMKQENYGWLLGCDFKNTIAIEKLDLFNTASEEGQVSFRKKIIFDDINEKINEKSKYLYPGEVE